MVNDNLHHVLVKAFKGEPVHLVEVSQTSTHMTVRRIGSTANINLPKYMLFIYDGKLFQRLKKAYKARDTKKLSELWQEAKPIPA
jgi:hypothetical protein